LPKNSLYFCEGHIIIPDESFKEFLTD